MTCIDVTDIIQMFDGKASLEEIDTWLDTPNEILDGITPSSAIFEGRIADLRFAASCYIDNAEKAYRRQYAMACHVLGQSGSPPWDALTPPQRERIREIIRRFTRELRAGQAAMQQSSASQTLV